MKTIGGTMISAIRGGNPWKSPYQAYCELIGEEPMPVDNDAVRRGLKWESALINIYETKYDIDRSYRISDAKLVDPEHEFLTGSPDAMYVISKGDNETCFGLEVKTADIYTRQNYDIENQEIPVHYFLQCQWYAGLAGFDRWDFIVGFFRDDNLVSVETCSFDFDQELYDSMVDYAVEFWNKHVVLRNPPSIESGTEMLEVFRKKYPRNLNEDIVEHDEAFDTAVEEIFNLQNRIKSLEDEIDKQKAFLVSSIGDMSGLFTRYGKVTYKNNKDSTAVDYKSIVSEINVPEDVLKKYTTTKPGARVLRLPRNKGE